MVRRSVRRRSRSRRKRCGLDYPRAFPALRLPHGALSRCPDKLWCRFPLQVTWDGHSGSMARTQQAAQANITLQEQIEAIHKAKGLVPEDDTKEKIGPSKPNEIPQQPPPPSSATNIPSSAPPITSVPRPPAVSQQPPCHWSCRAWFLGLDAIG